MIIDDSVLQSGEKTVFALRRLYSSCGYTPYRMGKFEEYDFYSRNKDFLVSDNVITFTDTNGKLMALKPDVTLSIIKNSADMPRKTQKVYYNENVYRVSKSSDSFRELMQCGVECFGNVGTENVVEVIALACESLAAVTNKFVLALSNLSVLEYAVSQLGIPNEANAALYKSIGEKNRHAIKSICREYGISAEKTEKLLKLVSLHGGIKEVKSELCALLPDGDFKGFFGILGKLENDGFSRNVKVDFSVIDDINYYNGIVFKGFVKGVPNAVLSGGQYDKLMKKLGRKSSAVGFAVYIDTLAGIEHGEASAAEDDGFVNVALPKGRLGERVYGMFAKAGFECPSIHENNRKLVFENGKKKIRFFWVKPSDVAVYVEHGAADIGVVGKDIIEEQEPDVFEMLDLKTGNCFMAVAAPKDSNFETKQKLVVATTFSNIAKKYYRSIGRDIDIIHLNGSIEIAPVLGIADVIVDIVETGTTLKENNLEVKERIMPISARLIANKASFRFKCVQIEKIAEKLSAAAEETK